MIEPLNETQASGFARLALAGVQREFPNKLDHVLNHSGEVLGPRSLHPAFFGCFDWHSCVHAHWLLVRILRLFPGGAGVAQITITLDATLTPENIRAEVAYLKRPNSASFERTYGWAWLLKLAEELGQLRTAKGDRWSAALAPLADAFVDRYLGFLPKASYPIRTGLHSNSAFGLAFASDYAGATGHQKLADLVRATAQRYYSADRDYPAHLEPGGNDFLSPALMEADLMRRVLPPDLFREWFGRFLPSASQEAPTSLFEPAVVSDRGDPQIVHLDGLNLSRAWCFRGMAAAFPENAELAAILRSAADRHIAASLPHVCSGDYAGEHWLATFALLALSGS